MKKLLIIFMLIYCLLGFQSFADASPVSIGDALTTTGDGVNSRWVDVSYGPGNVDSAIAALALSPGDTGYVGEVNQVVSTIDFVDPYYESYYGDMGYVSGYSVNPLGSDENFAVAYYGYINITETDTYTFNAFTDDGFRLNIGGEMIGQHYGNRSPGSTTMAVDLEAGLYTFELIGWEQGGVFVNELSWRNSSETSWSLVSDEVLFSSNPVPEPATLFLLGSGLLGIAGLKRRRK